VATASHSGPFGAGGGRSGYEAIDAAITLLADVVEHCGVAELTAAVREQIRLDVDAIAHAADGVFADRGVQAAALDRHVVIATQVAAAEQVLRDDPLSQGLAAPGSMRRRRVWPRPGGCWRRRRSPAGPRI
jgi:hypothetical protein